MANQYVCNAFAFTQVGLAQMPGQSFESHNLTCKGAPTSSKVVPGKPQQSGLLLGFCVAVPRRHCGQSRGKPSIFEGPVLP